MKVGPGIGDLMPATMCAVGIVSAILRAHKTGRGQFVDVGMVDAILSMCERIVHQHSFTGGVPVPEGNHHPLLCPFGMFPAKDGYVTIAAHADTHLPDPLPADRQAGDGHRPAARPPCRTAARTRTRSSPRSRPSPASAPSRSCWPISAARCRSRRSTTCATSSPIRTSPPATWWCRCPIPGLDQRHQGGGRGHQDERDARPRAPSRPLAGRAHRRSI